MKIEIEETSPRLDWMMLETVKNTSLFEQE